ncbi:MAG: hypothetical protein JNJ46_17780 [Myxococcales bacterium]|nr:hypothetical protein [Myxococcales bacterium]
MLHVRLCLASLTALMLALAPYSSVSAAPPDAAKPAPGKAAPGKAAPAKGKGKKAAASGPKNSALSAALSDKGTAIQKCAIEHAMERGANKCSIDVRVTINRTGGVVDRQIDVTADGGDSAAVKSCVETLVNTAKFPAVPTPLATAQQNWTVVAQ